jgi:hypothetical protein
VLIGAAFCYQFGLDVAGPMLQVVGTTMAALGDRLPIIAAKGGQRGRARLDVLLWVTLAGIAGLAIFVASGCASHHTFDRPARVEWWTGPPCTIEVYEQGDPKPRVVVEAPGKCEPKPKAGGKP